jgi:hypothetical protein
LKTVPLEVALLQVVVTIQRTFDATFFQTLFLIGSFILESFLKGLFRDDGVAHRTLLLLLLSGAIEPLHEAIVVQNVLAARYLTDLDSVRESVHADHTFSRAELVYFFIIFAILHLRDHFVVICYQVAVLLSLGFFLLSATLSSSVIRCSDQSVLENGFLPV